MKEETFPEFIASIGTITEKGKLYIERIYPKPNDETLVTFEIQTYTKLPDAFMTELSELVEKWQK